MSARGGLTARQAEVAGLIDAYVNRYGRSLSYRDICRHLGASSTNAASEHVKWLEKKGALVRSPFHHRSLAVNWDALRAGDAMRVRQWSERIGTKLLDEFAAARKESAA